MPVPDDPVQAFWQTHLTVTVRHARYARIAKMALRKAINMRRVLDYVKENSQVAIIGHRPDDIMDEPLQKMLDAGWTLKETVYIGGKRIRTIERDASRAEATSGRDVD